MCSNSHFYSRCVVVCIGDTCVIGAVYGPSDVRMAKELPHRAAVDVLYRPKITGSSSVAQLTQAGRIQELKT